MSVELNSAPSTPKSAPSSEGRHVKGKASAAGDPNVADSGGFSSLLMMLGSDEGGGGLNVAPDTGAQPLDVTAIMAGQLLQNPLPMGGRDIAGKGELVAAQAVQVDAVLARTRAGAEKGAAAAHPEADTDRVGAAVLLAAEKGAETQPAVGDLAKDAMKALRSSRQAASKNPVDDAAAQLGAGKMEADWRAHKLPAIEDKVAQSPALPQVHAAAGAGESDVRQDRLSEKRGFKIGGGEGGAWGHQALLAAGRIDPPAAAVGASALSPEMMVAEQVHYLIGRDVQNAELKMDGLGKGPVEVSISLQGNEARVEFRTDQLETRQVLEGAVSHLKDLLGSEGLVLSGVSVGSSGSGGAAFQERRPQQNSRQAMVAVPGAQAVDTSVRPAHRSGRVVDLFV